MAQKHKNIILLVSGVADTFFSTSSRKQLAHTNDLDTRIQNLIENNQENIFGYVDLLSNNDQRKSVNIFSGVRPQRVVSMRLNANTLIDSSNELNLVEEDKSILRTTGAYFDHILRPEDYEIHICGVDLHGIYKTAVTQLLEKGYKVYLYSDMIKRYKDTEENIKAIRNKNFEYCSSKLALSV